MLSAFVTIVSLLLVSERTCNLGRGCSPGQADRHPLGHVGGRHRGDAPLCLGVPDPLVPERQLVRDGVGDGAAMRAFQQALLLKVQQVPADGGRRCGQVISEIGYRD